VIRRKGIVGSSFSTINSSITRHRLLHLQRICSETLLSIASAIAEANTADADDTASVVAVFTTGLRLFFAPLGPWSAT
jgi:hypothetical protein